MKLPKLSEVRKVVAAVLGFAAEAVATGVLSGTALHVVQAVLAVATAVGVYAVPNGSPLVKDVAAVVGDVKGAAAK